MSLYRFEKSNDNHIDSLKRDTTCSRKLDMHDKLCTSPAFEIRQRMSRRREFPGIIRRSTARREERFESC